MKRALLLGLAALALLATRPGNEQQLIQQLNGQPSRWTMPDGGRSGVFTQYDAGVLNSAGCMPLTGATVIGTPYVLPDAGTINKIPVVPNVLVFTPLAALNVCIRPSVFSGYWDGGCTFVPNDENYGPPVSAGVPQYITPDSAARWLCAISDAGVVQLPVLTVQ